MEFKNKSTSLWRDFWKLSKPQIRAFHMAWFAFFVCFLAWFGIAPLMKVVREEDGSRNVRVVDPDNGEPRITAEPGKSGYMAPVELVRELHSNERFGHFFRGSDAVGAGAKGSDSRPSGRNNPFSKDSFNLTEQMRLKRENPQLWARLRAEA